MSKKGEKMICIIWSGYQPGVYIGSPNRRKHFSKENNDVIIEIDGDECTSSLPSSF
ncbi:MAG: hypothetical protein HWN66_16365 [Candidatus Helarchaeota archaeon]|nr:hypothetical protein [Candidatus Helarchaeota archaeon]